MHGLSKPRITRIVRLGRTIGSATKRAEPIVKQPQRPLERVGERRTPSSCIDHCVASLKSPPPRRSAWRAGAGELVEESWIDRRLTAEAVEEDERLQRVVEAALDVYVEGEEEEERKRLEKEQSLEWSLECDERFGGLFFAKHELQLAERKKREAEDEASRRRAEAIERQQQQQRAQCKRPQAMHELISTRATCRIRGSRFQPHILSSTSQQRAQCERPSAMPQSISTGVTCPSQQRAQYERPQAMPQSISTGATCLLRASRFQARRTNASSSPSPALPLPSFSSLPSHHQAVEKSSVTADVTDKTGSTTWASGFRPLPRQPAQDPSGGPAQPAKPTTREPVDYPQAKLDLLRLGLWFDIVMDSLLLLKRLGKLPRAPPRTKDDPLLSAGLDWAMDKCHAEANIRRMIHDPSVPAEVVREHIAAADRDIFSREPRRDPHPKPQRLPELEPPVAIKPNVVFPDYHGIQARNKDRLNRRLAKRESVVRRRGAEAKQDYDADEDTTHTSWIEDITYSVTSTLSGFAAKLWRGTKEWLRV